MPVVGYIGTGSRESEALRLPFFHEGLTESGYVEGQSLGMEYRWANHQYDRLPELAAELVRRPVAVIATGGGTLTARAVKDATAGPRHPVWGDGYQAAVINYQFLAHAVMATDETVDGMR